MGIARIERLPQEQAPQLLSLPDVGPVSAAAFWGAYSEHGRVRSEAAMAAPAGTCPIPASPGKTLRHRLNRGGNRHLNQAINTIALVRMAYHTPPRAYVQRRTGQGKTSREIRRCIKRYTTPQLYRTLASQRLLDKPKQHLMGCRIQRGREAMGTPGPAYRHVWADHAVCVS